MANPMTPSKTITIAHSAVTAKLVDASKEDKLLAQQLLSYRVEGFAHMRGFGGQWDGRSSFFEFVPAHFPAGFVVRLYREFTKRGYKVNLVRKPLPLPLGVLDAKVDSFPPDERYDYQIKVVELLSRYGQIIAKVATGGGKSRIAKLAVAHIARKTLFLTTRSILMHQMRDSFVRDMGMKVSTYGDDEWSGQSSQMNVGMVQTFAARIAAPDPADPIEKQDAQRRRILETFDLLQEFEFVILEEAHEASGNSYFDILKICRNAHYRLALTATPFMKDSEEANMRLEASSGTVAIEVSEQMLIERGILARPYFKHIDNKPYQPTPKILYRTTPYQKAYEFGVVKCPIRNKHIIDEVKRAIEHGLSAMVLVVHKEHGKILLDLMTDAGICAAYIQGSNSQPERQAALNALKQRKIQALIGSNILDVGVDVPAVGLVVLAGAGKAEVALRQRIGRGLREKKDGGPNVCLIVDFNDGLNNHLRDHARERRMIIDTTPGFAQGVVSDFDYPALGFKRAA